MSENHHNVHTGHEHHAEHMHVHGKPLLDQHHSVLSELSCHFPYAVFSIAMAIMFLLVYTGNSLTQPEQAYRLFHCFHFLHILFAATGTVLTLRRYSNNTVLGVVAGALIPLFFCTVSDAFIPFLGGKLIGLDMHFHWCMLSHLDTIGTFLFVGMLNGFVMSGHAVNRHVFYSIGFHIQHIFISAAASLLYLISFGFADWFERLGLVFVFLIVAVLIPCTLSDIVVPMLFSRKVR